eukprot:gene31816-3179_t
MRRFCALLVLLPSAMAACGDDCNPCSQVDTPDLCNDDHFVYTASEELYFCCPPTICAQLLPLGKWHEVIPLSKYRDRVCAATTDAAPRRTCSCGAATEQVPSHSTTLTPEPYQGNPVTLALVTMPSNGNALRTAGTGATTGDLSMPRT